MIKLNNKPHILRNGRPEPEDASKGSGRERTMAYRILSAHNRSRDPNRLALRFDSLISHDITYVGIIQTAIASGLERFPMPYVLTNCHNSLCAVGGTINADDHVFGLSAAKKYGGIFVPANMAVIHQYAREELSGCSRMILGSDSHTRYGALGTMGVGEGGPELVKQLLGDTYDAPAPEVVLVWLTGAPRKGVGPQDVAIALCGAVYKNNFVKNKILEFAGPGVKNLPMDYRIGIDVMTTETACLSSIWQTDRQTEEYFAVHGRPSDYKELNPQEGARYDALVEIDLSQAEPMAALPFHPSEAVTLRELIANPGDILREVEKRAKEQYKGKVSLKLTDKVVDGKLRVDQGFIGGCAGGMYDNIAEAAAILDGGDVGQGAFELSVYPSSIPVDLEVSRNGVRDRLNRAGVLLKSCFCGPCFGAGDVPANNALSIRHATRNFPNREGSKPGDGQLSAVLLMDSRSIAATAAMGGILTSAADIEYTRPTPVQRCYDREPYRRRVLDAVGKEQPGTPLQYGPNIVPWPEIPSLRDNLLLCLASVIHDPVTTTDELIPSGETSSYRSNPLKLASFALSRRDPAYVGRTEKISALEKARVRGDGEVIRALLKKFDKENISMENLGIGSVIFAEKPGDGSAREQAASCQRVLGGEANICREYATKRYRSNCVNWGMLPFVISEDTPFDYAPGDWILLENIRAAVENGSDKITAKILRSRTATGSADVFSLFDSGDFSSQYEQVDEIELLLPGFAPEEREIVLSGCLMNNYREKMKSKI